MLVEVRKPGRPLSSCPHPSGSCSCERVVINYTIPKSSECACPSERAQPTATVAGNSRIQKNRRRSTVINTLSLEKAFRSSHDTETDTSSIARTPTERSESNEASPPSSASSTPRILPEQKEMVSSCCKPKPVQPVIQKSSCCSNKAKPIPEPAQVKSCCSGPSAQANNALQNNQQNTYQQLGQQFPFQRQPHMQAPHYQNFPSHMTPPAALPFGLGAPIYNHAAAAYHQPAALAMSPIMSNQLPPNVARHPVGQHVPEHNCHCGESCSCFGCAAHPNNATMMEYVRLMAQFQYTGGFGAMSPPLYDMPTFPHHPGFGAEAGQSMDFTTMSQGINTPTPTQMSFQAPMNMPAMPNAAMTFTGPWQQTPHPAAAAPEPQFLEPSSYTIASPIEGHVTLKTEDPIATPSAESPSDSNEEGTTTLSPSSYFWNQMVLPGCNDATGTCQCGDGCACVGCLTHGGHNGVHLETPALREQDPFPSFSAENGLHLDDSSNFLAFDTTPT